MKPLRTKFSYVPHGLLAIAWLTLETVTGCAADGANNSGSPTQGAETGSSSGGSKPTSEAGASSGTPTSTSGASTGSNTSSGSPSHPVQPQVDASGFVEAGGEEASAPPGDGGSTPPPPGGGPAKLPAATGTCPTFKNGQSAMIGRMPVVMYIDPAAKSKPAPGGPLILYYHATASSPIEVMSGFGQANINKVTAMGGVVAAFTTTACPGCTTTDDNYWYVEDGPIQDTVVACAIQQANIDTRHIHALGWSAGALHTMWVAFARSDYMASVVSYSGGVLMPKAEDPTNKVPAILTYGDPGADTVILDFNQTSNSYYKTYSPMGYYAMMCHHPGGHEVDPMVAPVSLDFFMDHPYKVTPEPYATTIPSKFPAYCHNMPM